jgi:hypothetical protein
MLNGWLIFVLRVNIYKKSKNKYWYMIFELILQKNKQKFYKEPIGKDDVQK